MEPKTALTLVTSADFERRLLRAAIESSSQAFRVISLSIGDSPKLFLFDIAPMEEAGPSKGPCEMRGVVRMDPATSVGSHGEFLLSFDFEDETLVLVEAAEGVTLEKAEWRNKVCLLYAFAFFDDSKSTPRGTPISVAVAGLPPLTSRLGGNGQVELTRPAPAVWTSALDSARAAARPDGGASLAELPTLVVRPRWLASAEGEQTELRGRGGSSHVFAELFRFEFFASLAEDFGRVEGFLAEFLAGPARVSRRGRDDSYLSLEPAAPGRLACGHFFRRFLRPEIGAGKLRDVHLPIFSAGGAETCGTKPGFVYFHYNQDGESDDGWGCAYRSLQTLSSYILLNTNRPGEVPSIRQIQETLVALGDKPSSFVGSREWIGSFEVSMVLQKLFEVECAVLHAANGGDVAALLPALRRHFATFGSPIMFGGGAYAYTLLGVAEDPVDSSKSRFLILDPHYKGADELKLVTTPKNKAVYWTGAEHFKPQSFYNFCCPQV